MPAWVAIWGTVLLDVFMALVIICAFYDSLRNRPH
jgi:hypothetical protein